MKRFVLSFLLGLIAVQAQEVKPSPGIPLDTPSHKAHEEATSKKGSRKVYNQTKPQEIPTTVVDSSQQICQAAVDTESSQRDKDDLKAQQEMAVASIKMAQYSLIGIWVSGILSILSLGIGLISILFIRQTNRQMRESEERAERHSESDIRAYIKIECIVDGPEILNSKIDSSQKPLSGQVYTIEITNVGKSTAHNLQIIQMTKFDSIETPDEKIFEITKEFFRTPVVALSPGATRKLRIPFGEETVSQDIAKKFKDGEWGVFIFGKITFNDIFGKSQFVDYRYLHKVTENKKFSDRINIHENGNNAT
jgi:hypothetical protein